MPRRGRNSDRHGIFDNRRQFEKFKDRQEDEDLRAYRKTWRQEKFVGDTLATLAGVSGGAALASKYVQERVPRPGYPSQKVFSGRIVPGGMMIPRLAARASVPAAAAGALGSYMSYKAQDHMDQIDAELHRREVDRAYKRGLHEGSGARAPKGRIEYMPGGKMRMWFRTDD